MLRVFINKNKNRLRQTDSLCFGGSPITVLYPQYLVNNFNPSCKNIHAEHRKSRAVCASLLLLTVILCYYPDYGLQSPFYSTSTSTESWTLACCRTSTWRIENKNDNSTESCLPISTQTVHKHITRVNLQFSWHPPWSMLPIRFTACLFDLSRKLKSKLW